MATTVSLHIPTPGDQDIAGLALLHDGNLGVLLRPGVDRNRLSAAVAGIAATTKLPIVEAWFPSTWLGEEKGVVIHHKDFTSGARLEPEHIVEVTDGLAARNLVGMDQAEGALAEWGVLSPERQIQHKLKGMDAQTMARWANLISKHTPNDLIDKSERDRTTTTPFRRIQSGKIRNNDGGQIR